MVNNGKNIIKVPINGENVLKAIKAAGYSIHSISKEIGFYDRTLRAYLNKNEMPILMLDAIEKALGDCAFFPGCKLTESIDYIRDKMTPDEFHKYCMSNILKYVSRHKHKNGIEDLKKAQVYLGWLIESEEGADETDRPKT